MFSFALTVIVILNPQYHTLLIWSFNCKYALRIIHTSLEIFRNLDVDNWHWGLFPLFPSGHRISFTLYQLHHQQKEARTGFCLDWTFSNNLWSDYKGRFRFPIFLTMQCWLRNWTVSLLFGLQGTMGVYVGWSGDARSFVFTGERCLSACVASHLSSLFQSRIVQSAEDLVVTGELNSTKLELVCAILLQMHSSPQDITGSCFGVWRNWAS